MPSSTSSSEPSLPAVPWLGLLAVAAALTLLGISAIELKLAALGYQPTARDTPSRWLSERTRAGNLGERALILVGASRFQLGLDLDALRRDTGLEPVQLAIDGSAGDPILEDLANDPKVRGTILFDYYDHAIGARGGVPERMLRLYRQAGASLTDWRHPAKSIESMLTESLHEHLRAYADGASPLSSLRARIIPSIEARQYLIMRPDRSRLADYTRVDMPEFYLRRVERTLGEDIAPRPSVDEADLARRIEALSAADNRTFVDAAQHLGRMAARIRERGGRVIFIAMPSSGLVREIEARRYPHNLFWKRFLERTGADGIHSADEPALQGFTCPDGSHLDARERTRFTHALVEVLKARGMLEAAPIDPQGKR